jgi:hypothetical protein
LEYLDINGMRILRTQDVQMCKHLKEAKTGTRSDEAAGLTTGGELHAN